MKKYLVVIMFILVIISWITLGAFVVYFEEYETFKLIAFLFLCGISFLVFQNINVLSGKQKISYFKSRLFFSIKCVLVFFIFSLLHYINSYQSWTFDLTFQKLYKVRDVSLDLTKMLANQKPLQFTFWGTREHWNQSEELLNNYKRVSPNVKLKWINPDTNPEMNKLIEGRELPLLYLEFGEHKKWVENIDEWVINTALNSFKEKKNSLLCFLATHRTLSIQDDSPSGLSSLKTFMQSEGFSIQNVELTANESLSTCQVLLIVGPQDDFLINEIQIIENFAKKFPLVVALSANSEPQHLKNFKRWLQKNNIQTQGTPVLDQSVMKFGEEAINVLWESQFHEFPAEWINLSKIKGRVLWQLTTAFEEGKNIKTIMSSQKFPQTWQESSWKEVLSGKVTFDEKSDKKGPLSLMIALKSPEVFHLVALGTDRLWMNGFKNYPANFNVFSTVINTLLNVEMENSIPPVMLRDEKLYLHVAQAQLIFYLSIIVMPVMMLILAFLVFRKNSVFKN
jgi:hypothetical protein